MSVVDVDELYVMLRPHDKVALALTQLGEFLVGVRDLHGAEHVNDGVHLHLRHVCRQWDAMHPVPLYDWPYLADRDHLFHAGNTDPKPACGGVLHELMTDVMAGFDRPSLVMAEF